MARIHSPSLFLTFVAVSFLSLVASSNTNQNAPSGVKHEARSKAEDGTWIPPPDEKTRYPKDPYRSMSSMYLQDFGIKDMGVRKDGVKEAMYYDQYGGYPYAYGYPYPGNVFGFPGGILGFPGSIFRFPRGLFGFPGGYGGFPGGYGGIPGGYGGGKPGGPGYGGKPEVKGKEN